VPNLYNAQVLGQTWRAIVVVVIVVVVVVIAAVGLFAFCRFYHFSALSKQIVRRLRRSEGNEGNDDQAARNWLSCVFTFCFCRAFIFVVALLLLLLLLSDFYYFFSRHIGTWRMPLANSSLFGFKYLFIGLEICVCLLLLWFP